MKGCLESHLNEACGAQITKDTVLDLYKVITSHCDTEENSPKFNEIELLEW